MGLYTHACHLLWGIECSPKIEKTGTAGVVENLGGHMFLRQNLTQQKGFMVEKEGGALQFLWHKHYFLIDNNGVPQIGRLSIIPFLQ